MSENVTVRILLVPDDLKKSYWKYSGDLIQIDKLINKIAEPENQIEKLEISNVYKKVNFLTGVKPKSDIYLIIW